jgi:hypothetical protein
MVDRPEGEARSPPRVDAEPWVVDREGDSGGDAPDARSPVVDDLLELELHSPCVTVASPIRPRATYFQFSLGTLA